MKILWYSNSPISQTGYASTCKNVTPRLKQAGHEVFIFGYYGHDPASPLVWDGIPVLPRGDDLWGRDMLENHMKFVGADVCIMNFDIWVFPEIGDKIKNLIAYAPVDHEPIPAGVGEALKKCWKAVPFTPWSKKEQENYGINAEDWIPDGIPTDVFYPRNKEQCKEKVGLEKDVFTIGMVAGNYDKEGRKRFDKNLEAIKYFKEQNPNARFQFYMHTDVANVKRGYDLVHMIKKMGLEDVTKFSNPYYFIGGLETERVAEIINSYDAFINISGGEGFGLPALEAMGCGVPAIQTDYTAMRDITLPELKVKVKDKIMTPLISYRAIPDSWDAYKKLQMLFNSPDKQKKLGKKALNFAKQFDWDKVVNEKWLPFLDQCESELREGLRWKKI